jgi:NADH-quinone oxidoreductase subunit A
MDLLPYAYVAFFLVFGVVFVMGAFITNWLLVDQAPNAAKREAYECGVPPVGPAWMQFHVGYYMVALVFVVFEVETAFLFPWAAVFRTFGDPARALATMGVFLGILLLGLAYAWRKGAIEWH